MISNTADAANNAAPYTARVTQPRLLLMLFVSSYVTRVLVEEASGAAARIALGTSEHSRRHIEYVVVLGPEMRLMFWLLLTGHAFRVR